MARGCRVPHPQAPHRAALGGAGRLRQGDARARAGVRPRARPAPARPISRSPPRSTCLMAGKVERIILSRPAVEAGERLGFLPGDLREKVDPYLRPIFDALNDMLPADQLAKRLGQRRDRGGADRLHARPHAGARLRDPRRGAEHDAGADEDVSDPARRRLAHGGDRRPDPGRSAARHPLRPRRRARGAARRRGHRRSSASPKRTSCATRWSRASSAPTRRATAPRAATRSRGERTVGPSCTPASPPAAMNAPAEDACRDHRDHRRATLGWTPAPMPSRWPRERRARRSPPTRRGDRRPVLRRRRPDRRCRAARLNRTWRGKDAPTNVLAFALTDPDEPPPPGAPVLLGDVVLAFETVAREAAEQRKPLGRPSRPSRRAWRPAPARLRSRERCRGRDRWKRARPRYSPGWGCRTPYRDTM